MIKKIYVFLLLFAIVCLIVVIKKTKYKNINEINKKISEHNFKNDEEFYDYILKVSLNEKIPKDVLIIDKDWVTLENNNINEKDINYIIVGILSDNYKNALESFANEKQITTTFSKRFAQKYNSLVLPNDGNKINSTIAVFYFGKNKENYFKFNAISFDDSIFEYKYNFSVDDNYYLDDIGFVSKEMIYDSEGNKIPKPNKEKTNGTTFIYNIFNLCIGENVPEIYIGGNGDWVDSYNVFHKELALTDNYKNKHKFMECLIPDKNYFYVDIAKNKNGKIADFDKRYVQIYVKFDDKDVLYDVNFKLDDNFIDDVKVSTSSIVYKDNSPKGKYEKMYNVHKLTDIEYNGQNVFD